MIRWMLQSGPDKSHLHDYKQFDRLKEAKREAAKLPLTPHGENRPYVIRRLEFTSVNSIFDKITGEQIVVNKAGPAYDKAF